MSKRNSSSSSSSSSSSRSPTKRIITELAAYNSSPSPSIVSLAPTSPANVFQLSAILSGHALPTASGYHAGRWLVALTLPTNYPMAPPAIRFVTPICHPNVAWQTGDICLDVLKENWTPVLGLVGALESVVRLTSPASIAPSMSISPASSGRATSSVPGP